MPSTIVCAQDVRAHLGDRSWVVIDCRHMLADFSAGRTMYEQGHIPGAFFASVEEDMAGTRTGKNGRHPLPDFTVFAGFLRSLGVNDETQVVAYDGGGDMFAARMWYLLRLIGHENAALLDGGIAAWTAADYPVETAEPVRPNDGTLHVNVRDSLAVSLEDVRRSLDTHEFTLLDARGSDRFNGQNETIDPVAGHIPGAINRPFRANFAESGRFKPADELRAEFAQVGVPVETIVHQCGSGVSAAVNMLAMEIAGLPLQPLYPGSWSEWCSDTSRPMVTP